MSAERAPVRVGDLAVIHAPLVAVEVVESGFAEVTADGLVAHVPIEWLAVIHDHRPGTS